MAWQNKGRNLVLTIVFMALLTYPLASVQGQVLVLSFGAPLQLVLLLGISAIVVLLIHKPLLPLAMVPLGMGGILWMNRYDPKRLQQILQWNHGFLRNLWYHLQGMEYIESQYSVALWLALMFLIGLYTGIVLIKFKRIILLLPPYSGLLIYYWYIHVDRAYPMLALFLFLILILMGIKNGRQLGLTEVAPWMKSTLLYGMIIVLVALMLPKGGRLISWPWLDAQVAHYVPEMMRWRKDVVTSRGFGADQPFDFAITGFQPAGRTLGGPVKLKEDLIMEVEAPFPMYLRGNVKTIYRDNQWWDSEEPWVTLESEAWLGGDKPPGKQVEIKITYGHLATNTLFSPNQPLRVLGLSGKKLNLGPEQQLELKGNAVYRGERYYVQAWIPRTPKEPVEFEAYPAEMSRYWRLPLGLDKRIYQLGKEITQGLDNPYDKAKAIEAYLKSNYQYTLIPDWVPEGKEFVSYFLFESQEGYCTYFATAMVVLLRTQGIPARYVEGYVMPAAPQDRVYQVRGNNAHAWVEAYMPWGWMTFEPTPPFTMPVIEEETLTESLSGAGMQGGSFDEMEALMEWALAQEAAAAAEGNGEILQGQGGAQTHLPSQASKSLDDLIWQGIKGILYGFALTAIPLRMLFCALKNGKGLKRLQKARDQALVQPLYWQALHLLDLMGYGIQEGETPREYALRIHYIIYDSTLNFKNLTEDYVKAQYGQGQGAEEVAMELWRLLEGLDRKLKVHLGPFTYLWIKYFKGKWIGKCKIL